MKKYKTRIIYTVTREDCCQATLSEAKFDFRCVQDEVEEYLYAGVRAKEDIVARLEIYDAENKRWMEVKTCSP